jgi:hypothetical protein
VTAPAPGDGTALVGVELAHLRDSFDRFGRDLGDVKTSVAVLVERSTRVDADVRQLRADAERELAEVRAEQAAQRADVEALKRWRWIITGAATAVGTIAGAAASALGH